MKNILIIVLAIVVGFASCKSTKEVTEIKKEAKKAKKEVFDTLVLSTSVVKFFKLDSKKICNIQYFLSSDIELYYDDPADTLTVRVNSKVDTEGKLLTGIKTVTPDVIIPKGTPCVVDKVGPSVLVRFASDSSKSIHFLPLSDGIFYPVGKLSTNIRYGDRDMFLSEESLDAHLYFCKDALPQENNTQTEQGVMVKNKTVIGDSLSIDKAAQQSGGIQTWAPAGENTGSGVKKELPNGDPSDFFINLNTSKNKTEQKQETKPANQTPAKKGSNAFDVD